MFHCWADIVMNFLTSLLVTDSSQDAFVSHDIHMYTVSQKNKQNYFCYN